MKYKVKALPTYEELDLEDKELNRIPKVGEEFVVDKKRLDFLLGKNSYCRAFVSLVEEIKEEKKMTKDVKDV